MEITASDEASRFEAIDGRVLVTGANGHLGLRLLQLLAQRPGGRPSLRAAVRSDKAARAIDRLGLGNTVECHVLDWSDEGALARACEDVTHVVHLVGILKQMAGTSYADAHESSATALARAAEKAGVRRIVYPSILGADSASRNTCLASKGRAERILLERFGGATVIRLPMVLGTGDPATAALRAQATAPVVPLVRGGATREQPIDARDVGTAILGILARDGLAGLALDLAGPESLTHRELVLRVAALWGRRPRIVRVPYGLVRGFAALAERLLANPPLTRPMLEVLEHDDDIDPRPACARLGLALTPLDDTLRHCLGPQAVAT